MEQRKIILCFGDSNTWGYAPIRGIRFPENVRWPGVLQRCLGHEYEIVEEGMNGRTVFSFYPDGSPQNGCEYLTARLRAFASSPVSVLIIYLGINDIFYDREVTVTEIADRLGETIVHANQTNQIDEIVLMSPLPVNEQIEMASFYELEIEKARKFADCFRAKAMELGCHFVDPAKAISASELDGVHIDGENHVKLGKYMCDFLLSQEKTDGQVGLRS
jgi:lysophospholipase L1-like esterase